MDKSNEALQPDEAPQEEGFPYISHLKIEGFKSFKSAEVDLKPLNIFVGPNGAGKSNLIAAFKLMQVGMYGDKKATDIYVNKKAGADTFLHYGANTTDAINFDLYINAQNRFYETNLHYSPTEQEGLSFSWTGWDQPKDSLNILIDNMEHFDTLFIKAKIYHAHDTASNGPLKLTSKTTSDFELFDDFSNLPAFLYRLKFYFPQHYHSLVKTIQLVAPYFQDFELQPYPESDAIRLKWKNYHSENSFDVNDLSDGTLRFIALATVLLQPDETLPSLILLDEPELGLHPFAIQYLAGLMKVASARTQIIAATQSVTLINEFEWEDLVIADYMDGASRLRRISEEETKHWVDDFSLGDLWERNWIGGTPGWRGRQV